MPVLATCLGHPRIGLARELKRGLESYWAKKSSVESLENTARKLRCHNWETMKSKGIDHIPSNDFSLYDHVLDTALALGVVPERYRRIDDSRTRYFAMARGLQDPGAGVDLPALEMTKWFDTNYHYIVPELERAQRFALDASKLLTEVEEARAMGIETRPVVLGPVTFLLLSKHATGVSRGARPLDLLQDLLPVYAELLEILAGTGVKWVQLDEPCLVLDLDERTRGAYGHALPMLAACSKRPRLLLTTYFGPLGDNVPLATESGCEGLHVDLVRAPEQLDVVLRGLRQDAVLSLGLVDGRDVWRTDLDVAHGLVRQAIAALGSDRVWIAPSCSLLHVPVDLAAERKLDSELSQWLAFASQKLDEVRVLADAATSAVPMGLAFDDARSALASRRASSRTRSSDVRARLGAVTTAMLRRMSPFRNRADKQRRRLQLPLLPTTTIGSFPQTADVRGARAAWRSGRMTREAYDDFLRAETRRCIERQEALGIDVLVHGEFERSDMVEYFAEQLEGFACTENGWVQSYGSRCVKPPILFGDVARPKPMTLNWVTYAQSLTSRPVKGMLTGPATLLAWSFVRDDQPRRDTCMQIALALRDEVSALEDAGIRIIQIDEPALREGLPLRRRDWNAYLEWAVEAFRLASSGVRDETQIHTHMCYSEFNDILESIASMDADVLLIEASRSKMELLVEFERFDYPNEIGPGVYDIHSPRVPTSEEMAGLIAHAARVLSPERLWVNPDCGLKTRRWPEVEAALGNMVEAARRIRQRHMATDSREGPEPLSGR